MVRMISCNCSQIFSLSCRFSNESPFLTLDWSKSGFWGCVHWTFRTFRVAESVSACCCCCCSCFGVCGGFKWIIHVVMSNRRRVGRSGFEAANEIAFCQRSRSYTDKKVQFVFISNITNLFSFFNRNDIFFLTLNHLIWLVWKLFVS